MEQLDRLEREQTARTLAQKDILAFVNDVTDEASFVEKDAYLVGKSLLDGSPAYGEGVLTGTALIDGKPVVIIAQNAAVLFGGVGVGACRKMVHALHFAQQQNLPVVSILDSGGVRVGEGTAVLEGLADVLIAAQALTSLHVVVLKGQAVGMMAAYALSADFRYAIKDSTLSVVAPAVLLADSLESQCHCLGADAMEEHGKVDGVFADTGALRKELYSLFGWIFAPVETADDPNRECPELATSLSADLLLSAVCDDGEFIEFRPAVKGVRCVFTYINGQQVGLAITCRADEGSLNVPAIKKLQSFICELNCCGAAFISLVDSDGIVDLGCQPAFAESLSGLAKELAGFANPMIGVACGRVMGNAYSLLFSKGAGFAYNLAFATAEIGVLPPESAIHLVFADELHRLGNTPEVRARLAELYSREKCSPFSAGEEGFIDEVIHPAALRPYLAQALQTLQ